jgi:hypothetical protein
MSVQSINPNLPKLKIPSLFGSSQSTEKRIPNPLKFTTESSLEETNKLNSQKNEVDKKPKPFRTSENWYG